MLMNDPPERATPNRARRQIELFSGGKSDRVGRLGDHLEVLQRRRHGPDNLSGRHRKDAVEHHPVDLPGQPAPGWYSEGRPRWCPAPRTARPLQSEAAVSPPVTGSTPTTSMPGLMCSAVTAVPAAKPPPPTGTRIAVRYRAPAGAAQGQRCPRRPSRLGGYQSVPVVAAAVAGDDRRAEGARHVDLRLWSVARDDHGHRPTLARAGGPAETYDAEGLVRLTPARAGPDVLEARRVLLAVVLPVVAGGRPRLISLSHLTERKMIALR